MAVRTLQRCALLALLLSSALCAASDASTRGAESQKARYIIAHRGASGALPEHTLPAYKLAVDNKADFIECDIVLTKDKVPICRHDIFLSDTTDADEKFPGKVATYSYDDVTKTGVFAKDLTLREVKQLRCIQPNELRDPQFDGLYKVPTFEEHIRVAQHYGPAVVGIYPETKFPQWHNDNVLKGSDTRMDDIVLDILEKYGYKGSLNSDAWKKQPVFIQSFEVLNLQYLATKTSLPLVQLLRTAPDDPVFDINATVSDLTSDAGLADIAEYAAGIGPGKGAIVPPTEDGYAGNSTGLVARAHAAGLQVHPYTFRAEYTSLLWSYGADLWKEFYRFFEDEGVDGVFTDFPDMGVKYLDRIALGNQETVDYPTEPWNALSDPRCPVGGDGGHKASGKHGHKHHKKGKKHDKKGKKHHKTSSKSSKGASAHHSHRALLTAQAEAGCTVLDCGDYGSCKGGITAEALTGTKPIAIAHRGDSGILPEHTIEAYSLAVEHGVDFIECDVVVTKDRQLICRHEPLLSDTTNADDIFPEYKRNYTIDGTEYSGVFSVDLSLAQIRKLRAVQRVAERDPNYDGQFKVPTLDEYITVALTAGRRPVGIYPETKHPTWHDSLPILKDTTISDLVLAALEARGYEGDVDSAAWARQPAFIQSFEVSNLKALARKTDLPLVQLGSDFDAPIPDMPDRTYGDLFSAEGLADVVTYATGVGPYKGSAVPIDTETNTLEAPTSLGDRIRAAGLQWHPYTLRNEAPLYLPYDYVGDPRAEYDKLFKGQHFNGGFSDNSGTLVDYFVQAELEGFDWTSE